MSTEGSNPERSSFEEVAVPLMDAVAGFALSLTKSAADAEDLLQDTYLKAFRSWDSFEQGTNCRAWLFRICRNTFYRSFRRESSRSDVEAQHGDADALPAVVSHIYADSIGLNDVFDRIEVRPALKAALDGLPAEFRRAVDLVDLEGFSYSDAADVLDVPIGTVRSRLSRARRRMQESLIDHAVDMGFSVPNPAPMSQMETPVFPPDCEVVVRALWDIIDGEVTAVDEKRFRAHLDECAYCRAHENFERRLVREIAELRTDAPGLTDLVTRVRGKLAPSLG